MPQGAEQATPRALLSRRGLKTVKLRGLLIFYSFYFKKV